MAHNTDAGEHWLQANQAMLTALFDVLHQRLAEVLGRPVGGSPQAEAARCRAAMPAPPATERLAALFGLDPFASDLVLLAAAVELDGRIAAQVAELDGPAGRSLPSIATAFRALPGAHWSAFAPGAPLRRWRLIELDGEARFTARCLRLDERVLHFLLGLPALDARLEALLRPLPAAAPGGGRIGALAERLAVGLAEGPGFAVLSGRDPSALGEAVAAAAVRLGRVPMRLELAELSGLPSEHEALTRLLQREAALSGLLLVVGAEEADDAALRGVPGLLARLAPPCVVLARGGVPTGEVTALRIDCAGLSAPERMEVLRTALGRRAVDAGALAAVAGQFDLPAPALRAAAARATAQAPGRRQRGKLHPALWEAARAEARPLLDDLAERLETKASWDDLVLPPAQMTVLRQIAAQVGHRLRVYDQWGFRDRLSSRGLGITALFVGASGTGKTFAAEVIAGALSLDLYRIDLSAVVSKYIGETEKNLRRIFDAAEAGGAVLLFDEADALFGKRSEVKDSHDRYANIEVGYLLQRMESYGGLAVLTTNMKQNLDQAFMRRIRFVVEFPFPGAEERAAIWQRVFPAALPHEGLDPARLAQMNLPGGAIRNVALNAAFLAAADGQVVRPAHVLAAARSEYAKLEKPLTGSETRGWAEAGRWAEAGP
ncbi:MAG: hypothetical protein BGP12_11610 [Rhodospirillales bacterium 70-18]|nr:MAG: hypothetical protein BGP12_11610 [Rhodospirillales bacterium 70-18]